MTPTPEILETVRGAVYDADRPLAYRTLAQHRLTAKAMPEMTLQGHLNPGESMPHNTYPDYPYAGGVRVRATRTICENAPPEEGDPSIPRPERGQGFDPRYVHALKGDTGIVRHVEYGAGTEKSGPFPTVFFDRTQTGTAVSADEVELA